MRCGARYLCFLAIALTMFLAGCGGGSGVGGSGGGPAPPPLPEFPISFTLNTVSVAQGTSSSPVTVSVTGTNGFSGTVSVTLTGVPSGIVTNPASPFTASAAQSISVIFGAAPSAATGQFSVDAQGTNGSLSHSATLALTIQAGAPQNPSRSGYVRNDSV